MATPTDLVVQYGRKILFYEAEDNEEVSYKDPVEILAILSGSRDTNNLEEMGRVNTGEKTMTVSKDLDISNNRNGLPDVVKIDGEFYQIEEVINAEHPMMDIWKKTAVLKELDAVKHSVLEPED